MIDIRKLKELVRLMVSHDLTELDLRDSEEQVTLRRTAFRHEPGAAAAALPLTDHAATALEPGSRGHGPARTGAAGPERSPAAAPSMVAHDEEDELATIASPMVGTFYSRPNPDTEPFVSVGSRVGPDTVVCLIEAMKIFNEIRAEVSGTIEQIIVSSGEAVEFGQPLFRVRPD
jgi:acetyl-CoA carboxylase biotin carboxyl carrier protein